MTRRRKPAPAMPAVGGGELVRCPRGHASVRISHGRDLFGPYLNAWCTAPGCGAKQTVRRKAA